MCKAPGKKENDEVSDSRTILRLYSCMVAHSDKFLVLSDATTAVSLSDLGFAKS